MKVLHVIPSVATVRGGPSQAILAMVKALRSHGVDAEIATTNDNGTELLDVPLQQCIEYEQVPVWFFPRFSPPMKEFIFSAALTQWLWQHARHYDIIHSHYLFSYAPTCAGAIARWQGVPYIVRTIGQLSSWSLAQSQLKKQAYTILIERHNLNRAAAIHCTSADEAQDVRNFGIQTPTFTLPLGVDRAIDRSDAKQQLKQVYGIPSQAGVVLFLSRLHYKKRPELLVQALSQQAVQSHDFHLILAGAGEPEYVNYLKNLVASVGLAERTSFAGFVTGEDKNLLLQGSDIFVLPSFSENFGVAVAEAMAAGLPAIVTPGVQIASEVAAAQAGVVVRGEADDLSKALCQLLSSQNLRDRLGENGKRLVSRRYSWQAIAENITSVYTTIIERQPLDAKIQSPA